ncbi:unnamed protein product [Prunus armeniaca]
MSTLAWARKEVSILGWAHKGHESVKNCMTNTTTDTHQPPREPTHDDNLWRNPRKLNLLICPTGRATKEIGRNFEDALCWEVDQANSTLFTAKIEQVTPPRRFSMPLFTHFKGDSDLKSHLKHFKSVMILYKADDALMCKAFAMALRGAAQD